MEWFIAAISNEHYLREFLIDSKNIESIYFVLGLIELSIEEFTKSCLIFFYNNSQKAKFLI